MLTHREDQRYILTVNSGSSSLKATVYNVSQSQELTALRKYEAVLIGQPGAKLTVSEGKRESKTLDQQLSTHIDALQAMVYDLSQQLRLVEIKQVGYRVVHGGQAFFKPVIVNKQIIKQLAELTPLAPEHMPPALDCLNYLHQALPKARHVACFDTEFFHDLPAVAQTLPLPLRTTGHSVRRYGFHGLSYEYLLNHLQRTYPDLAKKRLIIAHLGSGSSLAAIQNLRPIDTTMGFSPSSGLMMSTRSGDLDPGLVLYLQESQKLSTQEMSMLVNHHAGLLGVSGSSADMETLLHDSAARSRLAVQMFCLQVKKAIGAFAALLGGVDGLVFSGGIGCNAPKIRQQVCEDLDGLGMSLDAHLNASHTPVISSPGSRTKIFALETDEQIVIAQKTIFFGAGAHHA